MNGTVASGQCGGSGPGPLPRQQSGGLDSLLAGVEEAVGEARRQAAAAHSQAAHWQQQYERERLLREQQEQAQQARQQHDEQQGMQIEQQQLGIWQAVAESPAPGSPYSPSAARRTCMPPPERSVSVRTAVAQAAAVGVPRRHTAPALRMAASLGTPELLNQLSNTASQLEALQQELARDIEAGKAADGSVALSRLSSLLHACSFLRDASVAACSSRRSSADLADEMGRQDSGAAAGDQGGQQEVALHDDGAAGVGATAAAAVSVALAQSWAAAAGARQASFRHAAAAEGAVRPGKARFKLVAAVPRSYRGRREQQQGGHDRLAASASRSLLAGSPSQGNILGSPTAAQSASALDSLAEAEPDAMDDAQEATWRASGQHLKLQWMTSPANVLVVFKPVPAVFQSAVQAVAWLLQRGLTVWVEPEAWGELAPAVQEYLESNGSSSSGSGNSGGGSSWGGNGNGGNGAGSNSSRGGNSSAAASDGVPSSRLAKSSSRADIRSNSSGSDAAAPTAAAAAAAAAVAAAGAGGGAGSMSRAASANLPTPALPSLPSLAPASAPPLLPSVDVNTQLRTWEAPPCGCPPELPCSVGHQIDLVVTLGGDGTVLWTCGLFRAGAVPPLVPLAMGSLGFMTPFEIGGQMEAVLSRVTSLGRGMPLMLRHRLQCRIIRGDASSPDLASAASAGAVGNSSSCLEEFVVLNEVVIDRGMTAQLCNLQCFVDNAHVTVVQGDGLIVATPTGSTAYNLAAGGSMVHPAVPCFLFTPTCPHSLSSRPLVLPEHVTLRVKVPLDSRSSAYCSFDGRSRQELRPGDSIIVSMSQWPAPMVCHLDASHDWFLSMREGLHWNVRKQQAGRGQ